MQRASLVGSFEETMLRGKMSVAPSRPFDFVAQIGVMGRGRYSDTCPRHVAVDFPAVYYAWKTGQEMSSNGEPSPYVGHIDLAQSRRCGKNSTLAKLNKADAESRESSRERESHVGKTTADSESPESSRERGNDTDKTSDDVKSHESSRERDDRAMKADTDATENGRSKENVANRGRETINLSSIDAKADLKAASSGKKRKRKPLFPGPTGSYQIPQKGQLQVLIKYPQKGSLKIFLVQYDLKGMTPGTKTFIRQRVVSTPKSIEVEGDEEAQARLARRNSQVDGPSKPRLRYLIHLNICCTGKDCFFLYGQMHVIFSSVTLDGLKWTTETQIPEPRFSPWKPEPSPSPSRRPSHSRMDLMPAGVSMSRESSAFGHTEDDKGPWVANASKGGSGCLHFGKASLPVPAVPFAVPMKDTTATFEDGASSDAIDPDSSRPTTSSRPPTEPSVSPTSSYNKLRRDDEGYGGFYGRPATPEPGAGLLAKKLRDLALQREGQGDPDQEASLDST